MIFPDICLYNTDGTDVFLYTGVEVIVFAEYRLEISGGFADDQHQDTCQEKNGNKIYTGKSGIDEECHGHCTDQTCRGTGAHTQHHLISVLDVRHICGQTGDQTGCTEFVNVGKRKGLDVGEHCFPEVTGKAC